MFQRLGVRMGGWVDGSWSGSFNNLRFKIPDHNITMQTPPRAPTALPSPPPSPSHTLTSSWAWTSAFAARSALIASCFP